MEILALSERDHSGLAEISTCLRPHLARIAAHWRTVFSARDKECSTHVLCVLEPLVLAGLGAVSHQPEVYAEQISYSARKLAKLRFPLVRMAAAWSLGRELASPYLEAELGARTERGLSLLETWHHLSLLIASQAYDEVQRGALETLLRVLDAELASIGLDDLLQRLLQLSAMAFGAQWSGILLLNEHGALRHRAVHGWPDDCRPEDRYEGTFFSHCLRQQKPGMVLDAANDPSIAHPCFRLLEVKTVWAVPLYGNCAGEETAAVRQPLGVLHVDFAQVYEYLPQELELLSALGQRSALAIERALLLDSIHERQAQVRSLSHQLWLAEEQERRRIRRELHDESGQRLMALRLQLELMRRHGGAGDTARLNGALREVDRTAEGLRRIMARLSPAVLEELGWCAAVRRDLRRLRRWHGLKTEFSAPGQELLNLPDELQTVLYRVVQEALTNVVKHAHAGRVSVRIQPLHGRLEVSVEDDGVGPAVGEGIGHRANGLPEAAPRNGGSSRRGTEWSDLRRLQGAAPRNDANSRLGLRGMRERILMAGGELEISRRRGGGTRLAFWLPLAATAPSPYAAALDAAPSPCPNTAS